VLVVSSTEPVVALGALAAVPVLPVPEVMSASRLALSVPVSPAGVEVLLGVVESELGVVESELGVKLELAGVVTVADELAGQLSFSSEASCAFAVVSVVSSVETVCSAASSVEPLDGVEVAFASVRAVSSSVTFVSSDETVCWSSVTWDAAVPLGIATV
jgi:hypothetical protein